MLNIKKGAMFGLDARICLFIFALVSVLTYSVFYNLYFGLSAEKVLAETPAIKYGLEQYQADMNASIFTTLNTTYTATEQEDYSFESLVKPDYLRAPYDTKWNGPYIRIKNENMMDVHLNAKYKLVRLSEALTTTCNDVKTNKCYIYLKFKDLNLDLCRSFETVGSTKYSKVELKRSSTTCDAFIKLIEDYN
tara:strand:- start:289 stop:864 length:576 start_codon:yes stop_codon:yes gene_type:complete